MKCFAYDNHHQRNDRRHRKGFVLLLTLFLLAILGLLSVGIARRSLAIAEQAVSAEEDLQRRWAALSCQRSVLLRAERIFQHRDELADQEKATARNVYRITAKVQLGKTTLLLVLADENAKIDLNVLAEQGGGRLTDFLRNLIEGASSRIRLHLGLRNANAKTPAAFDSWGQVFALDEIRDADAPKNLATLTEELTCWGGGQLNVHRASDRSIEQVFKKEVSPVMVERLLRVRATGGKTPLEGLLGQLSATEKEQERFRALLTDESQCYSLWGVTSSTNGGSAWLWIAPPGGEPVFSFLW